jgi:hypothetical protein
VPSGVVCVKATLTFATTLEQRVYRPQWDVASSGVSAACKTTVSSYFQQVDRHEGGHWQDHEAIAAWYRAAWGQRTCYACAAQAAGQTADQALESALDALNRDVGRVVGSVQQAIAADGTDCARAFHKTHGDNTIPIGCSDCACAPPATPCGEACCAENAACCGETTCCAPGVPCVDEQCCDCTASDACFRAALDAAWACVAGCGLADECLACLPPYFTACNACKAAAPACCSVLSCEAL